MKKFYMRGDFMKIVKVLAAFTAAGTLALSLCGCFGEDVEVCKEPTMAATEEVTAALELETEYVDSAHRTAYANVFDFDSLDTQPMFAVAFLGYGDIMDARHTYVEKIFAALGDFAIEQVGHVNYEGDEWYLIVPRYSADVDITNLDTGEVHTIHNGEAFTVKCNLSDLHSNIEISTELNLSGHKFSPQMGGDGKLVSNPDVWDITDYIMEGE